MKHDFCLPISAIATSPKCNNIVTIGFFDGLIKCCSLINNDAGKLVFLELWSHRLKRSVRGLSFSDDGNVVYAISANRAIVVLDSNDGSRLRCVKRCHETTRPHRITPLPDINRYAVATGADNGQIKIWDFNSAHPVVATFTDQTESINALMPFKQDTLLAASSEATLAAYDIRLQKLRVKSETMNSELLSIAITDKLTCVGSGDGTIEIFKNAEYGNIMGRMKTGHEYGVDCMIELRPRLILTGSTMTNQLSFYEVKPNKFLSQISHFDGVEFFAKTCDGKYLIFANADTTVVYVRRVSDMVRLAENSKNNEENQLIGL